MKKEIKLTQKQEQVINSLNEMLAKTEYEVQPVSDTYTYMTAVAKIVQKKKMQ